MLRLNEGSVIELDRLAGDPLDILVNGTMIAKGEIVMVGERFGVRFIEIVDPEKRVLVLGRFGSTVFVKKLTIHFSPSVEGEMV